MAQPASASFPVPENNILIIRELKSHVDLFSQHLQKALENQEYTQQAAFLRDLSHNVTALDKLIRSVALDQMSADLRATIEESREILTHVLHLPVDSHAESKQITLVEAIKNYSTPSTRESDLSIFLRSLEKYPESFRILIQELHLISQDLERYL